MWQIISLCLGVLVMSFGIFAFPRIVLNKPLKISKCKFIKLLLVVCLVYTLISLITTGTIKTILIGIVSIIAYRFMYKISQNKAIFITFIYIILLMITEFEELLILKKVLEIDMDFCYNTYAGSLISNTLVCILFIINTFILRNFLRGLLTEGIENNKKIIMLLVLTFICIGMFFYTIVKEYKLSDDIYLYLGTIMVLLIMLFWLIRQTIRNNKITREYEKLLEFMKTYEREIEIQKTLRHETKNSFLAIKSKIQDKQENEEIIKYIDEILKEKIEVKQEKYAKFGYLPANGIKGLCYFKTQEAENKGIIVSINIAKKVENSSIYKLDIKEEKEFGKILGVFLDNAIEASLGSDEKKLGIEAYSYNNEFKMIISNTYKNEIDKSKIGKEKFSTKGKERGRGLLLVKKIVSDNDIFEINTDIREKIYVQTIIVK